MKKVPEYFLALVKQHANLVSKEEAVRAICAINSMLETNLEPKRSEYLFTLLPSYLKPSRQKFYVRLFDWQPSYKHSTALDRLKINLQLTDQIEAIVLLIAYFKAVKTVIEPQDRIKLARALPPELNQIYIKS